MRLPMLSELRVLRHKRREPDRSLPGDCYLQGKRKDRESRMWPLLCEHGAVSGRLRRTVLEPATPWIPSQPFQYPSRCMRVDPSNLLLWLKQGEAEIAIRESSCVS
jgi:hypothetical protein